MRKTIVQPLLLCLAISTAVNVALGIHIASSPDDPASVESAARVQRDEAARAALNLSASSATDAALPIAMLLDLERQHLQEARDLSARYWIGNGEFERAYTQALFAGLEQVREGLVRSFGVEVKDRPELRALFRPMDPMYSFLGSDQQLAIQRLKFERDQHLQSAMRAGAPVPGMSGGSMALSGSAAQSVAIWYETELRAILDEQALAQFQLRESPLAQQLRQSGVEFTQDEFLAVFNVVSTLQQQVADPLDTLAARDELREILGNRRFAMFWASRDPTFSRIDQIADRHSLTEDRSWSIYEILNEFQDERLRVGANAQSNPEWAAREYRELASRERQQIVRLVGEPIADEILTGRAVESFRFFNGAGRPQ